MNAWNQRSAPHPNPPLVVAGGLLLWGYATGLWVFATVMALVLEANRVMRLQWNLSESDFRRISLLSPLAVAAFALYRVATDGLAQGGPAALAWLPFALFPLILAQTYGGPGGIQLRSLFPIVTGRLRSESGDRRIDVSYGFLAVCVFSAAAANLRSITFFLGMVLIAAWALWLWKPVETRMALWFSMLGLAAVLGYAGQAGLNVLQTRVERAYGDFIAGTGPSNASLQTTAIGQIGRLKLSNRIALRLWPPNGQAPPPLLRTGSYTTFSSVQWISDSRMVPLNASPTGSWSLAAGNPNTFQARIAATVPRDTLIPLPSDTVQILGLGNYRLSRDQYGSVRLDDGSSRLDYRVSYGGNPPTEASPNASDLFLHPRVDSVFRNAADELGLTSMEPSAALGAVRGFFEDGFEYSLFQPELETGVEPLERFLTSSRSGHCEYFATATVLLLRAAGVHARYAVGFAVQEWSEREQAYLVRDRHAHAWARAFVDGRWIDVDTTPGSWAEIEAARVPWWQGVRDQISWIWYSATTVLAAPGPVWRRPALIVAILSAVVFLAWKIGRWLASDSRIRSRRLPATAEGHDSEFYAIEAALGSAGFNRRPDEPQRLWIERIKEAAGEGVSLGRLDYIVALHYRYRFDPKGLTAPERAAMRHLSAEWLENFRLDPTARPRQ